METRTINQVKIYSLAMNPMTQRTEASSITAMSYDKQALIDFYNREAVEQYRDDTWAKSFRKGSLLEWFNPLYSFEVGHYGHGIRESWMDTDTVELIKNQYYWV